MALVLTKTMCASLKSIRTTMKSLIALCLTAGFGLLWLVLANILGAFPGFVIAFAALLFTGAVCFTVKLNFISTLLYLAPEETPHP